MESAVSQAGLELVYSQALNGAMHSLQANPVRAELLKPEAGFRHFLELAARAGYLRRDVLTVPYFGR